MQLRKSHFGVNVAEMGFNIEMINYSPEKFGSLHQCITQILGAPNKVRIFISIMPTVLVLSKLKK